MLDAGGKLHSELRLQRLKHSLMRGTGCKEAAHPALEARVVRVPGDDGDADVSRQLQEVLRGGRGAPVVFAANTRISGALSLLLLFQVLCHKERIRFYFNCLPKL